MGYLSGTYDLARVNAFLLHAAQQPVRSDIDQRIRQPQALFSFLEIRNRRASSSASDSTDKDKDKEVKITLLDVIPPHLFTAYSSSSRPNSSAGTEAEAMITRDGAPVHVAAITIIMHGKQMGLLILGRSSPFTNLGI